jgi:hypothetical protein
MYILTLQFKLDDENYYLECDTYSLGDRYQCVRGTPAFMGFQGRKIYSEAGDSMFC